MRILTVDELRAANTVAIPLPGHPDGGLRCRRIAAREYERAMPPALEPIAEEPAEAREARLTEWRKRHADDVYEGTLRVLVLAAVEPVLTLEDARGFGDHAFTLLLALLEFSGLRTPDGA